MLIETLEDGRIVMDRGGVQAFLVNHLGKTIAQSSADHPVLMIFQALHISGPLENAIERLVGALFNTVGEPTDAVYDLYKKLFGWKMNAYGDYFYFKKVESNE